MRAAFRPSLIVALLLAFLAPLGSRASVAAWREPGASAVHTAWQGANSAHSSPDRPCAAPRPAWQRSTSRRLGRSANERRLPTAALGSNSAPQALDCGGRESAWRAASGALRAAARRPSQSRAPPAQG
jgi:hypothetical protein